MIQITEEQKALLKQKYTGSDELFEESVAFFLKAHEADRKHHIARFHDVIGESPEPVYKDTDLSVFIFYVAVPNNECYSVLEDYIKILEKVLKSKLSFSVEASTSPNA
jgi:hypothetical protein